MQSQEPGTGVTTTTQIGDQPEAINEPSEGTGWPSPYIVEFMGLLVLCNTPAAALDLARLIAAEK